MTVALAAAGHLVNSKRPGCYASCVGRVRKWYCMASSSDSEISKVIVSGSDRAWIGGSIFNIRRSTFNVQGVQLGRLPNWLSNKVGNAILSH